MEMGESGFPHQRIKEFPKLNIPDCDGSFERSPGNTPLTPPGSEFNSGAVTPGGQLRNSPGILCLPIGRSPRASLTCNSLLDLPSPIITRRTRTLSTYERALDSPLLRGKIKYFSRVKGHGYILAHYDRDDDDENATKEIFVHISDIEGEYIPMEGDEVTFRMCPMPPKEDRYQAISVNIITFSAERHLKWDSPIINFNAENYDDGDDEYEKVPNNLVT